MQLPANASPRTRETIVCWYSQGNHYSRVSQVVQDFVHPQCVGSLGTSYVALSSMKLFSLFDGLSILLWVFFLGLFSPDTKKNSLIVKGPNFDFFSWA